MLRVFNGVATGAACCALVALPAAASARGLIRAVRPVRVGVQVSGGPWSATLKRAGVLPNDPHSGALFGGGPVIGGKTLAMIGLASFRTQAPELLLYTKGAGGWVAARPPGVYPWPRSSTSTGSFSLAVGSGLVAVSEVQTGGSSVPCGSPVFTAGSVGFSGRLTPAACLSDNSAPVAASANTVVAAAGPATLEVFAEPAGGWSGSVAPVAQLQASDGASLSSVSMSGTTIAAVGRGPGVKAVYIFTEPASGWSGVIHETARITFPGFVRAARLSGATLVVQGVGDLIDTNNYVVSAPVFVLRRPAVGWQTRSSPQPRAFVQTGPDQDYTDFGLEPASVLGGTTAFTNITLCGDQGNPPCHTTIWAVNGLTSIVAAPRQLPVNPSSAEIDTADGTPLASDGTTLALGADGVRLYTIAHTAPARVSHAALTGLSGPNTQLRLTVIAGKGAAALASVRVLVPTQLGGGGHVRTIALKPAKRTATVTLRRLHPTAALRRAVSRIAAHGGRTTVTVPVELIDNTNHSSDSQVTLTIAR